MKQLLLTMWICLVASIALGQNNKFHETTEEEYNYMVKGYQVQKANGLDMKRGYEEGFTISFEMKRCSVKFIEIIRTESKYKAGTIVVITQHQSSSSWSSGQFVSYGCIPNKDSGEFINRHDKWIQSLMYYYAKDYASALIRFMNFGERL